MVRTHPRTTHAPTRIRTLHTHAAHARFTRMQRTLACAHTLRRHSAHIHARTLRTHAAHVFCAHTVGICSRIIVHAHPHAVHTHCNTRCKHTLHTHAAIASQTQSLTRVVLHRPKRSHLDLIYGSVNQFTVGRQGCWCW